MPVPPLALGLFAGSSLLGIGAGLLGSQAQQEAARDAARLATKGTEFATGAEEKFFRKGQRFISPFQRAGAGALPFLQQQAFNLGSTPGLDLARREGIQDIARSASARGKLGSGQTAQNVSDFTGNLLAQEAARRETLIGNLTNFGAATSATAAGQAGQTGSDVANIFRQGFGQLGQIAQTQGQQKASNIGLLGQIGQLGLNAGALAAL